MSRPSTGSASRCHRPAMRRLPIACPASGPLPANRDWSTSAHSLPPGDLRMALAALCGDDLDGRLWADVLPSRFAGHGPLAGHAIGNLLIAGLWQRLADPVEGLDMVGQLLGVRGRVLPMSAVPLAIEADVVGLRTDR